MSQFLEFMFHGNVATFFGGLIVLLIVVSSIGVIYEITLKYIAKIIHGERPIVNNYFEISKKDMKKIIEEESKK